MDSIRMKILDLVSRYFDIYDNYRYVYLSDLGVTYYFEVGLFRLFSRNKCEGVPGQGLLFGNDEMMYNFIYGMLRRDIRDSKISCLVDGLDSL